MVGKKRKRPTVTDEARIDDDDLDKLIDSSHDSSKRQKITSWESHGFTNAVADTRELQHNRVRTIIEASSLIEQDRTFVLGFIESLMANRKMDDAAYLKTQVLPRYISWVRMKTNSPTKQQEWDELTSTQHLTVIRVLAETTLIGSDVSTLSEAFRQVACNSAMTEHRWPEAVNGPITDSMKDFIKTTL